MKRTRTFWQPWQVEMLVAQYPHMHSATVAVMVQRPLPAVYAKAYELGLRKTPAFLASPAAGRMNVARMGGPTRFKKGQASWNKGRKGMRVGGRAPETQFPKGHKPHNWVPVGSERIRADGYLERKLTDTGYPPRDWVPIHRINWIAAHGPIPKGYVVRLKDGDKSNCAIENLELISHQEQMRRNTLHNYPKEIASAIQLRAALNRRINRATRTP